MNLYELMVILSPSLPDEEEKQQVLQIEELLKHEKATIHLVDHWGKRKLAYSVKRQRQGFYEWFYFETEPGRIAEIERKLKMAEQVLRFLLIRMEKAHIEIFQKELARRKETPPVTVESEVSAPEAADLREGSVRQQAPAQETELKEMPESSSETQEQ